MKTIATQVIMRISWECQSTNMISRIEAKEKQVQQLIEILVQSKEAKNL